MACVTEAAAVIARCVHDMPTLMRLSETSRIWAELTSQRRADVKTKWSHDMIEKRLLQAIPSIATNRIGYHNEDYGSVQYMARNFAGFTHWQLACAAFRTTRFALCDNAHLRGPSWTADKPLFMRFMPAQCDGYMLEAGVLHDLTVTPYPYEKSWVDWMGFEKWHMLHYLYLSFLDDPDDFWGPLMVKVLRDWLMQMPDHTKLNVHHFALAPRCLLLFLLEFATNGNM